MNLNKYAKVLLLWRYGNKRRFNYSTIAQLLKTQPSDDVIVAKGWIKRYRNQKRAVFCQLGDGLSPALIQVVFDKSKFGNLTELGVGSAVQVVGKLVNSPGRQQSIEMLAHDLQMHSPDPNNPFHCKQNLLPSTLRLMQHLRPKSDSFATVLRIRSSLKQFLHNYLQSDGYIQIDTPIITSNDCEGAGTTFTVQRENENSDKDEIVETDADSEDEDEDDQSSPFYFGRPVYLTVSAQLHLEAIASGIAKVYTFNPTFRAEKSRTRNHLAEFYMLEAELAFCNELEELMQIVESIIKSSACHILQNMGCELSGFSDNIVEEVVSYGSFVRLSFSEVGRILDARPMSLRREKGLNREQELYITKHCGNRPVFITNYPQSIKPFYMKISSDNDTVECFDLLLPGLGEVCGGSLRETNVQILRQRVFNEAMSNSLDWYIDLRESGHAPLGGFGIGFERLMQYLLGINTVRDCIAFPRWFKRCSM